MATVTPRSLFQFQPGAAPTLGYTAPSGKTATVRGITIANPTASTVTAYLWYVPPGGSVEDGTIEVPGVEVAAKGMMNGNGVDVLEPGWSVYAQGDGLTITGSGAESS